MSKGFWFLFLITLIFMIGLFSLLYKSVSLEVFKQIEEVKFEPLENFEIKKEDKIQVITNKNLGFLAKVPKNWKYQLDQASKGIIFYSEDINLDEQNFQNGCLIGLKVEYQALEKTFSVLKNTIAQLKESPQNKGNFELLEIDKKDALKETTEVQGVGKMVKVSLPQKEKIFLFDTLLLPQKEKECQKYFEEFLNSIELKD